MKILRNVAFFLGVMTLGMGLAIAADPTSNVRFNVIRDYNGKPVRNASVILHPVNKKGQQERSGLQLKTDGEGNTNFDGVPYGPLRIQVLAPGFQTYGEDFDISKPETQITIKLKRPVDQYSTYGSSKPNSEKTAAPDANAQKPPAQNPPKAEAKDEVKSKPKKDAEAKSSASTAKQDSEAEASKDKPQP